MDNAIESKLINNVLVTLNSLKSFIKQIVHAQSSLDAALKKYNEYNEMTLLVVEKQMSTLGKNKHTFRFLSWLIKTRDYFFLLLNPNKTVTVVMFLSFQGQD